MIEETLNKISSKLSQENLYTLIFCPTCEILRPPRSFHCDICNTCIELHDHHCPWLGTCVGKRNNRYFALFLGTTALHAGFTFLLTTFSFVNTFDFFSAEIKSVRDIVTLVLVVYSCIFSLALTFFFTYQNKLILMNVTGNESIRKRWNSSLFMERMRNKNLFKLPG